MSKIDDYNRSLAVLAELRESLDMYRNGRWSDKLDLTMRFIEIKKHNVGNDSCYAEIRIPGYSSGKYGEVYETFVLCLKNRMEAALEDAVAVAESNADARRIAAKEEALSVLDETSK